MKVSFFHPRVTLMKNSTINQQFENENAVRKRSVMNSFCRIQQ